MILQIELTEEELKKIQQQAHANGFDAPEAYVKSLLIPYTPPGAETPQRRTKARELMALPPHERQIAVREALLRAKDRDDELFEAEGDLIDD